jgi:hypothetical protein
MDVNVAFFTVAGMLITLALIHTWLGSGQPKYPAQNPVATGFLRIQSFGPDLTGWLTPHKDGAWLSRIAHFFDNNMLAQRGALTALTLTATKTGRGRAIGRKQLILLPQLYSLPGDTDFNTQLFTVQNLLRLKNRAPKKLINKPCR